MDKSITLQCWLQQLSSNWLWGYPGIFAGLLEGIFFNLPANFSFRRLQRVSFLTRRMSERNTSTFARFRVCRMQGNLCRKILQTCRIWIQCVDPKTKSWLVYFENVLKILLRICYVRVETRIGSSFSWRWSSLQFVWFILIWAKHIVDNNNNYCGYTSRSIAEEQIN